MRWRLALAVVMLLSVVARPASAGFRIEEVDPAFPNAVVTSWFQGGVARVDGALEGLTVVVDLRGGQARLYDSAAKRYAEGAVADLAAELKAYEATQGDEAPGGGSSGGAAAGTEAPLAVTVKDLGPAERLHDYDTRHYQVLVKGELVEELWLAPKLDVSREIDAAALASALQKMLGGSAPSGQGYEESQVYRSLRAQGYPMRQVLHFVGEQSVLEVKSVATQEIPAADFAVPKGFTKIGYIQLLYGEGD